MLFLRRFSYDNDALTSYPTWCGLVCSSNGASQCDMDHPTTKSTLRSRERIRSFGRHLSQAETLVSVSSQSSQTGTSLQQLPALLVHQLRESDPDAEDLIAVV